MNGSVRARVGVLTVLSSLLVACVTTHEERPQLAKAPEAPPPDWQGEPLSWEKLEHIEAWLGGDGPWDWPEYVPEAELELAEGRLTLARRERDGLPPAVLDSRLRGSRDGFREVIANSDSTSYQVERAERGLVEVTTLLALPDPEPATPVRKPGFEILPRNVWAAKSPAPTRLTANRKAWTRITVHHSALPSLQLVSSADAAEEIRDIQTVHMRDKRYGDIGYHFVIDPKGRIYQGRDLRWQGAHAGGDGGVNNVGNIGICLLGDFDHERPDPRALTSLEELIEALRSRHGIAPKRVKGHQDYKATQCPGRHLESWVIRYSTTARRHASAD